MYNRILRLHEDSVFDWRRIKFDFSPPNPTEENEIFFISVLKGNLTFDWY